MTKIKVKIFSDKNGETYYQFCYCCIDEGHHIRNILTKCLMCKELYEEASFHFKHNETCLKREMVYLESPVIGNLTKFKIFFSSS